MNFSISLSSSVMNISTLTESSNFFIHLTIYIIGYDSQNVTIRSHHLLVYHRILTFASCITNKVK